MTVEATAVVRPVPAIRIVNISIALTSVLVTASSLFRFNNLASVSPHLARIPQWDSRIQLTLIPALALTGMAARRFGTMPQKYRWADLTLCMLASAIVVSSAIVRQPDPTYSGLWAGFDLIPSSLALVIALSITLFPRLIHVLFGSDVRLALLRDSLLVILITPGLLLFLQPPNGLINLGDATYHVLDELLAPLTGSLPYGDYTPQYSGALGWVLVPLRLLSLSGDSLLSVTIWTSNAMNLSVALVVVAVSRVAFPGLRRLPTFAGFVALWTVCGPELGYSTQIREFSQFGRYLPSLVAFFLVVRSVKETDNRTVEFRAVAAGLGLTFAILNSADHGLTFAVATLMALCLLLAQRQVTRKLLATVIGVLGAGLLCYVTVLFIAQQPPNIHSYWGLRAEAVSNQIYTTSWLTVRGPHLLVFFLPVSLIALVIKREVLPSSRRITTTQRCFALTASFWALGLLGKYLVSPAAIGVRYQFIPAFLCGIAILCMSESRLLRASPLRVRLQYLPLLFAVSLTVGSLYPLPNVKDELKRISGRYTNTNNWSTTPGRPVDGWTRESLNQAEMGLVMVVEKWSYNFDRHDSRIAYFGGYGKTVEVLTGVKSVLGIAAAESLRFGSGQARLACVPVERFQPDFVITYLTELPCHGYHPVTNDLSLVRIPETFAIYQRVQTSNQLQSENLSPPGE